MNDHPATLRYANAFAMSTGLELDDLLQEARMIVRKCEIAVETGRYDPTRASFNTYVTNAIYKAMCTATSKAKRIMEEEDDGGEVVDETTPAPDHRLLLTELIRELPDDARRVVELVLSEGMPDDLVDAAMRGTKSAHNRLRSYIRGALRLRRGDRAGEAFDAIGKMLVAMRT